MRFRLDVRSLTPGEPSTDRGQPDLKPIARLCRSDHFYRVTWHLLELCDHKRRRARLGVRVAQIEHFCHASGSERACNLLSALDFNIF